MITVVIILIVCIIIPTIYKARTTKEEDTTDTFFFMWTFMAAILVIMLLALVSNLVPPQYKDKPSSTEHIISLDASSDIRGHFALGCGAIESELVYYYYIQDDDGGYHIENAKAENSTIFETDKIQPRIKLYLRETWQDLFLLIPSGDYKYEFHIPINSIIREYNPNVKGES